MYSFFFKRQYLVWFINIFELYLPCFKIFTNHNTTNQQTRIIKSNI